MEQKVFCLSLSQGKREEKKTKILNSFKFLCLHKYKISGKDPSFHPVQWLQSPPRPSDGLLMLTQLHRIQASDGFG